MGVVRLFLALVVVTAHFQQVITRPNGLHPIYERFSLGFHSAYAVLFFYVISGFLITYTLLHNYVGKPGGAVQFYKNRAVRIFSLYWPLGVISLLFMPGAAQQLLSGTLFDKFTWLFLLGADWNLDFANFPDDNWNAVPPGLHPAWTLGAEMTFYVLAPLLIRNWRVVLGVFLASLTLRAGLVAHFGVHIVERWTYYFTPSTFLFFLAGQGVCMLAFRFPGWKNGRLGCGLVALAFATMFFTHDRGFDIARLWISIGLFTVGLPGFFEATKNIRWMNAFGNLSYPVYLTHPMAAIFVGPTVFYFFADRGLATQDMLRWIIVAFLVVSVVVGMLAHILVEKPVARAMKAALSPVNAAVQGENLLSVQILRAIAAFAVCGVHFNTIWMTLIGQKDQPLVLYFMASGVDLFFVISGFVMVFSSEKLFGQQRAAGTFFTRRLVRVVPLYWVATAIGIYAQQIPTTTETLLKSLLFIPFESHPHQINPLFGVGWTLNYEMFFYVVFAGAIMFSREIAVYVASAIILLIVLAGYLVATSFVPFRFWSDPIVIEFVFGMLVALGHRRGWRMPWWAGLAVFVIGAAAISYGIPDPVPSGHRWLSCGVPAALMFAGLVLMPPLPSVLRGLGTLGDASYSLYLLHTIVLAVIFLLWPLGLNTHPVGQIMWLGLIVTTVLSLATYRWFERPVTKLLRRVIEGLPPGARQTGVVLQSGADITQQRSSATG